MTRPGIEAALPFATTLALLACGGEPPARIEHVASTGAGEAWLTGNRGLAARWDGQGFRHAGYPMARDPVHYRYASTTHPTARVIRFDGQTLLVTRGGELLRWHGEWEPLGVELDRGYRQVDAVVVHDGRIALLLHDRTLRWAASFAELARGELSTERLPTYFTWLGVVGSELYAIGYDDAGVVRVLRRWLGPGEWGEVARLPIEDPLGVLDLGQGRLGVLTPHWVAAVDRAGGAIELIEIGRLVATRAGDDALAGTWARAYAQRPGGPARVVLSGRFHGLLEWSDAPRLHACPELEARSVVGVTDGERGVEVFTHLGEVLRFADGPCERIHERWEPEDG